MRCLSPRCPSFLVPAIVALLVQPVPAADDWADGFYQFRLPVEIEAEAAGWQVLPIEIGRAACRERVEIPVVAVPLKNKHTQSMLSHDMHPM